MLHAGRKLVSLLLLALPLHALAQGRPYDNFQPWWIGAGMGAGSMKSDAPAPAAGRGAMAASLEAGFRFTPNWGLGLELGAVAPVSGCAEWSCSSEPADFAPSFNRLFAFGEYRAPASGWHVRAGAGVSRFCYDRHWSHDAWSMFDTLMMLIDDEYLLENSGSGAWRCDAARRAFGGAVSVGYDWKVGPGAPVSMGVRLSAEAANYARSPAIGLPAFKHRAVMLTLHVKVN